MRKILKELRPSTILILLVIGLLFLQAMAELALPDYMSHIINIGIQQNGIINAVPEVLKIEDMDKIEIFLSEEDKEFIQSKYLLIGKQGLSDREYNMYLKRYPVLNEEDLYILNTSSKADIEYMNSFLNKAIFSIVGIEQRMAQGGAIDLPQGADPFLILKSMPQEQIDIIKGEINKKIAVMPNNILEQSAISYIKSKYQSIGMNIEKIQSNYILHIGRIMLLVALLGTVASILVGFLSARISASFGRNLRDRIFNKATSFSNAEFDRFSTASLITRSTNDIQQIQMFIVMLLRMVFYAPILGAGGGCKGSKYKCFHGMDSRVSRNGHFIPCNHTVYCSHTKV